MIRTMTWRGFRAVAPQVALPRETQAAAQVVQSLENKTDKLVKATSPDTVREVLSEGFAEAMLSMALKRDPHVSMWGRAYFALATGAATTCQPAQLFGPTVAAGAAGSGIAGVSNNLLSPRKPLKPVLIHNVAATVVALSTPAQLAALLSGARLALQRGKESIFELPLTVALSGVVWVDHTATYGAPVFDLEMSGAGGIEIEGHGAPYTSADDIGMELLVDYPLPSGGSSTTGNLIYITVRVDGETLE